MDFNEFENEFVKILNELNIKISNTQLKQFYDYMNLLIKWNSIMNLTRIIEPKEIIIKHFVDSLTVIDKINKEDKIIDVGTGAGFPGIPIKIIYPETKIVLVDSLNKRINFLNEVITKLELKNINAIHGRAEEYGRNKNYREKFDIGVARAVAPLNILLEYLMPFVKTNGKCICMKGSNGIEEIEKSANAIDKLNGKLLKTEEFTIPKTDINRIIIEVKKEKELSKEYPRKSGIPSKKPL